MIKLKLDKQTIQNYYIMKKQEYTDKITDLEKRFFQQYSEHFCDNLSWLSKNLWPTIKYALSCQMGAIAEENVDQSKYMMGVVNLKDLVDQHGSF